MAGSPLMGQAWINSPFAREADNQHDSNGGETMAGDWIKVEKCTPRKPEILRLAVILGIHPDHAFGLCVRFWSWCDDNLTSSNARGVTEALLDALLGHDGFASALVQVGWLQARESSLVIPNFDLHLSKGAKSRALTARRAALHRSRKSVTQSVTLALPEKRREEKKELQEEGGEISVDDGVNRPPSPFDQPVSFPDPVARFPQPIQEQSRRMLHDWHFWRYGSLPNLTSEATASNLNTIAGVAETFGGEAESKLKEFMQKPPPGFPRTTPLFKIFKHLGLEAPDHASNRRERTDNPGKRPAMSAGGGRYEGIKPSIAPND